LVPGIRAGNGLAAWIAQEMLAPARVLPLIGIGVALGSIELRARSIAGVLGGAGLIIGFWLYKPLPEPLWIVPRAAENRFLTGPVLAIAAGGALAFANRWRAWLTPPLAFIAGIALALGIVVTDPSVNDPRYSIAGVLIALWIVVSIALCARAFDGRLLTIASRIFGSWLLAIGLLYGAAAFSKRANVPGVPPSAIDSGTPPSGGDVMPPQ
jgi:hypothetical protein